jgi:hypothetical protein
MTGRSMSYSCSTRAGDGIAARILAIAEGGQGMRTSRNASLRKPARGARIALAILVSGALLARSADAQEGPGTAVLRGVVFDSTEMKALAGARVAVLGTTAMSDADANGRFELSGIPPGSHAVSFFHTRLQALGVSAPTRQIAFEAGQTVDVELSVPSERTLLMGWCMAEQPGLGFAAVAGVVTDSLTGVPLPRAIVTARVAQRRPGDPDEVETRADESGYYRLCTVPAARTVRLQARFGQSAGTSQMVELAQGDAKLQNLILPLSAQGSLVGTVNDYQSGEPLPGAVVSVMGTKVEQITDSSGGFVLDGLPPGRHLVTTEYLGYGQRTDSVTVFSQETVDIAITMAPQAVEVEGFVVTARTRFGRTRVAVDKHADVFTRAEIEPILSRTQNMGDLLRNMNAPGLSVREMQVTDATGVVVPGLCVEVSRRGGRAASCTQAAIFVNGIMMPNPDQILMNLDPSAIDHIEILGPIDAQFQFGSMAGNGAVLIYTR